MNKYYFFALLIVAIICLYGFTPEKTLNDRDKDLFPYCDYINDTIYFTDTNQIGIYNFHQKGKVLMDKPAGSFHVRSYSLIIPGILIPTKLNYTVCNATSTSNIFVNNQVIYNDLGGQTQVAFNAENIIIGLQVKDPVILDYEIWGVRK